LLARKEKDIKFLTRCQNVWHWGSELDETIHEGWKNSWGRTKSPAKKTEEREKGGVKYGKGRGSVTYSAPDAEKRRKYMSRARFGAAAGMQGGGRPPQQDSLGGGAQVQRRRGGEITWTGRA